MNELLLAFPIAKWAEYTRIMELHETMILKNDSKSAAEGSVEDADPKLTINERESATSLTSLVTKPSTIAR